MTSARPGGAGPGGPPGGAAPGRRPGALVAVDLGTSSTCVAVGVPGEAPRVVLVDGAPLMSSAVHAERTGLVVGAEAERRAAIDPARHEPHPKRRVDEGSLLLGTAVVPVVDALAAVLSRAVGEARAVLGGQPVATLVLTHPADWGGVRTGLLRRAAAGLAADVLLVPEPVAAAVLHGRDLPAGGVLAVLDVGAGTTDVSVLRREGASFRVLGTAGDPGSGGADVDEALLVHLGARLAPPARARWDAVLAGRDLAERRAARALRSEVRAAKESLSRHSFTDVALPAGLPDAHVSRAELEVVIARQVDEVVALLARALRAAGALDPAGRSRAPVFLVGGSSRVPLVGRTVHRVLGVVPVATDQPETVVARGAVLHARALAAARPAPPALPRTPARAPAPVPASPGPPAAPPGAPSAGPPVPAGAAPGRRRSRRRGWLAAAVVVVLAAGGAAAVLALRDPVAPTTQDVVLAAVTVAAPVGWAPAQRTDATSLAVGATTRVVLSPDGTTSSLTRLLLQETVLAEGSTPASVAEDLRTQTATARRYSGFRDEASYAGRRVSSYQEDPGGDGAVDWYVVVEGTSQVSVGCAHPAAEPAAVEPECEQAVASIRPSAGAPR